MDNDKNLNLKPCPFCGSSARMQKHDHASSTGSFVMCDDGHCKLVGPNYDPKGEKWNALPRWNEYSPQPTFRVIDLETGSLYAPFINDSYGAVKDYATNLARETNHKVAVVVLYAIGHPRDIEWSIFIEPKEDEYVD